jgi:hypothetical protein
MDVSSPQTEHHGLWPVIKDALSHTPNDHVQNKSQTGCMSKVTKGTA